MDKETQKLMFSSKSAEWETPQDFYEMLNNKFNFNLDPCCTKENAKCEKYFTMEDDGLEKDWSNHRAFMNPPYGRNIKDWIKKAYEEGSKPQTVVACLLPSRTDTRYWHKYCMKASEIYFVKGRLRFKNKVIADYTGKTATSPAPFPSVVVIFRGPPAAGMSPAAPLSVGTIETK